VFQYIPLYTGKIGNRSASIAHAVRIRYKSFRDRGKADRAGNVRWRDANLLLRRIHRSLPRSQRISKMMRTVPSTPPRPARHRRNSRSAPNNNNNIMMIKERAIFFSSGLPPGRLRRYADRQSILNEIRWTMAVARLRLSLSTILAMPTHGTAPVRCGNPNSI